jgi:uncharacterized protein YjbI with pentapeptide repeats
VLSEVDLDGANLDNANMEGVLTAPPPIVYIDDEPLQDILARHQSWCASDGMEGAPARLAATDFRPLRTLARRKLTALHAPGSIFFGLSLEGAQMQGADLSGCDFRGCNLRGADLRGAKLVGADLTRADLSQADLRPLAIADGRYVRADLTRAKLRQADLTRTRLLRARMLEADTAGAKMIGADLRGAETEI